MEDKFSAQRAIISSDQRDTVLCNIKWTKRELVFCGIGIVGFVLLIVAIILLGVGVGSQEDVTKNRTKISMVAVQKCVNAGCLESSLGLIFLRNTSVDPCEDFYAHACSSSVWSKERLKPSEAEFSVFHELREENQKRIENILSSVPIRTVAWSSEMKIKTFYQSCIDTYGNSIKGGKNFVDKILKPAGGWKALGTGWNENTYNLTAAMKSVHIDFWRDALFRIHVGTDMKSPTRNTIQVGKTMTGEVWI